jgi:hypothetical protein
MVVEVTSTDESIRTCTESYLCLDRLPRPLISFVTIILPFIVMAAIALAPLELDNNIKYTLAVFACISMLWTFGALPLAVTGLLVPVLLVFFGIFTPAGHPGIFDRIVHPAGTGQGGHNHHNPGGAFGGVHRLRPGLAGVELRACQFCDAAKQGRMFLIRKRGKAGFMTPVHGLTS